MTTSTATRHLSLAPCESDVQPQALARAEPSTLEPPRFGLPKLNQLALYSFSAGDAAQLLEYARSLAEALASNDGDSTRRRTISRALAVTRSQVDLLDAALGEALGRRDFEAVRVLTKLADSMTRRLKVLLEEHRAELGRDRPVQMYVAHADTVKVNGGR